MSSDSEYDSSSDLDRYSFDDASLDDCFDHLFRPKLGANPPRVCHRKLKFSTKKISNAPLPQDYTNYFTNNFPDIKACEVLKAYHNGKLFVSYKLVEQLEKSKERYSLIPVHYYNSSNKINNYYALLYDRNLMEMEFFRYPGSHKINNLSVIQSKINALMTKHLKLKVHVFYQVIQYQPEKDTIDYPYWPMWLVDRRLHSRSRFREQVVNTALKHVLKRSVDYRNFLQYF